MSGPQLKAQRVLAGVKAGELAVRMGIGRTRIPQIEAQATVSEKVTGRYLAALIELASEAKATA